MFALLVLTSVQMAGAQDGQRIFPPVSLVISYFGETVTHPGLTIGIEYAIVDKGWYRLAFSAQVGGYYHRRNHVGAFIDAGLVNRFTSSFGLFGDAALGVGYLHTWVDGATYSRQTDGNVGRVAGYGLPHLKVTGDFRAGYDLSGLSGFPGGVFMGLSIFGEYPFNGFFLPHAALQTGLLLKL
jgi:hypothetical protein